MTTIQIEKVSGTIYRFTCPVCHRVYESMYIEQLEGIAYLHLGRHNKSKRETIDRM